MTAERTREAGQRPDEILVVRNLVKHFPIGG